MKMINIKNKRRIGIFVLVALLIFLIGCGNEGKGENYAKANEQYNVGWVLHNIDGNTDRNLDFSKEEMAVYNYSYDFPGYEPAYYKGVGFWEPPFSLCASSSNFDIGVPNNRVFYLLSKTPPNYFENWWFSHYIYVNYATSDEEGEQVALDFSKEERIVEDFPDTPISGDNREFYIGSGYKPASIIVEPEIYEFRGLQFFNKEVKFNGEFVSTKNGYYIQRYLLTLGLRDLVGIPESYKEGINYKVYKNGVQDSFLGILEGLWRHDWFDYQLRDNDSDIYFVETDIHTGHPIWNDVKITTEFRNREEEINLPVISSFDSEARFELGKTYRTSIGFENDNIKDIKIYYASNENNWEVADVDFVSGKYESSFLVSSTTNIINLKIEAENNEGDISTWIITPIALKAREINIDLDIYYKESETIELNEGENIFVGDTNIELSEIDEENRIVKLNINRIDGEIIEEKGLGIINNNIFVLREMRSDRVLLDAYSPLVSPFDIDKDIYIIGILNDEFGEPLNNIIVDLYLDGNYLGNDITGFSGDDLVNKKGVFFYKYNDIKNLDSANIKVDFRGVGVYLQKEEEIRLN